MKKIIILNHYGYAGGTLVLSCLCKTLRESGIDCKLYMCNSISERPQSRLLFFAKNIIAFIRYVLIKCFAKILPFYELDKTSIDLQGLAFQYYPIIDKKNTIVIYPEKAYGNPLSANYVVRWLLSNRFQYVQSSWDSEDLCIAYRDYFNNRQINPNRYILTINYFDNQLYRQYNQGPREGNCYITRSKAQSRKDLPSNFDGPVFNDDMTQKELVQMFNTYMYCYSYDTQTFYTVIAAVCGCIPIVVMEQGKNVEDYLGEDERDHFGIAYGDSPEQIEYAVKTRDKLLASLNYEQSNKKCVRELIEILEQKYGKLKTI